MAKGRKVPPREPSNPVGLHVVGPWICSTGANLQHNAQRLIKVGWRYWAAIAERGYAIDGPGVVTIKIDRAQPPLPADARIVLAAWTPLAAIPEEARASIPDLLSTIDPTSGIVFVFGFQLEEQVFCSAESSDVPHTTYTNLLERQGLVSNTGVVSAMDLIEDIAPVKGTTPSA